MTLILMENENCPYANRCSYNKNHECYGANKNRTTKFSCDFVDNGTISEGKSRNPLDQTGQMKIIVE